MLKESIEKKEQVRTSELGAFINLIYLDTPVEDIGSREDLAKRVSAEFDVLCTKEDIDTFYNLDVLDESFEIESRKIEYYG